MWLRTHGLESRDLDYIQMLKKMTITDFVNVKVKLKEYLFTLSGGKTCMRDINQETMGVLL